MSAAAPIPTASAIHSSRVTLVSIQPMTTSASATTSPGIGTRNGTPQATGNIRRSFRRLCKRAGLDGDWTTYELRHSFVSLVSDQLDDLVKVADLVGHADTRTTQGYRHPVRPSLPHAIEAWDGLLSEGGAA